MSQLEIDPLLMEKTTEQKDATEILVVHEFPKFDLEPYISHYTGRAHFARLYHIGTHSSVLAVEALKAAVVDAKAGHDITRYTDAVEALQNVAPLEPEAQLDSEWVKTREAQNASATMKLEAELKQYKNNLIKESIRMGNEDLGNHYLKIGDLTNASKAFARMRDYCTLAEHITSMGIKQILVAIEKHDWIFISNEVRRIRSLISKPDGANNMHSETQMRLRTSCSILLGLANLGTKNYREAAEAFLEADPLLTEAVELTTLTSTDITVYTALCALSSMSRDELRLLVLENSKFRSFLELEPQTRRAIACFCNGKFGTCLEILESYRTDYLLDLHLSSHVSELLQTIRSKSIIQYFRPFSRVTLSSLSSIFPITQHSSFPSIEEELAHMIQSRQLPSDTRIDLEKGALLSRPEQKREEAHLLALETARAMTRESHLRLVRLAMLSAGLEVKGDNVMQIPGAFEGDEVSVEYDLQ